MSTPTTGAAMTSSRGEVAASGDLSQQPARADGAREASRADAATRGQVRIPARVVQRIAAQAASEVGAAGGRSGGLFGIGARTDLDARPEVDIDLSIDSVDVAIKLAVDYPVSLRAASQRVRDHVRERVERLTGVAVHRVDIDIIAVGVPDDRGRQEGLR